MLKARSVLEWTNDDIEAAITSSAEAQGYDELTSNESKVLQSFLSGSDVFVSLICQLTVLLGYTWSFQFGRRIALSFWLRRSRIRSINSVRVCGWLIM